MATFITKEQLIQELITGTIRSIATKYKSNYSTIDRLVKRYNIDYCKTITLICKQCNNKFEATKTSGTYLRQKFCSKKCNITNWIINHPEEYKNHQHKAYYKRNKVFCRACKQEIKLEIRKSGLVFCSDKCKKGNRKISAKKYQNKISIKFDQFKRYIGCGKCNYNTLGACLDFHHINPSNKTIRIDGKCWYKQLQNTLLELPKCILLCKNCHYELHYLMKNNIDEYNQTINIIKQNQDLLYLNDKFIEENNICMK